MCACVVCLWWNAGVQLAAFDVICAQMLQDVQERLVFRTHIYIRQEILNYNPASGDLAYPSKLEMMEVSTPVYWCLITLLLLVLLLLQFISCVLSSPFVPTS